MILFTLIYYINFTSADVPSHCLSLKKKNRSKTIENTTYQRISTLTLLQKRHMLLGLLICLLLLHGDGSYLLRPFMKMLLSEPP